MACKLVVAQRCLHLALNQKAPRRVVMNDDVGKPLPFGPLVGLGSIAGQALLGDHQLPRPCRRFHSDPCEEPAEEGPVLVKANGQSVAEAILGLIVLVENVPHVDSADGTGPRGTRHLPSQGLDAPRCRWPGAGSGWRVAGQGSPAACAPDDPPAAVALRTVQDIEEGHPLEEHRPAARQRRPHRQSPRFLERPEESSVWSGGTGSLHTKEGKVLGRAPPSEPS